MDCRTQALNRNETHMNSNTNLPPGCLHSDLDGATDYDGAFCRMLECMDQQADFAKGDAVPIRHRPMPLEYWESAKETLPADARRIMECWKLEREHLRGEILSAAIWLREGASGSDGWATRRTWPPAVRIT